ncbi:MAG TPA: carboxypeptidase-like regulatory domain-containing protein [Candidatus Acidoferrum sp.]|nr:carboxypeptidase-like regulatory domain-containing protein [Candidatus Acidoferrum sp.]
MRRRAFGFVAAILAIALLAVPAFANLTGDLLGTVTDATGAGVAGAKITIKNLSTGAAREVTTGQAGEYAVPQLEIGEYRITIEKSGFKSYSQTLMVRSGEKTSVDAHLQIGEVSEKVEVEIGAEPTLDVATAQVSDSLAAQEILALPNQGRDPVLYATLSPGMVPVTNNNPFLGVGSFNSNGSRGRANNITVDGVTATDVSTTGEGGGFVMSQDSVQEVKVITNNFDAEFGRNSGSQVQILTKGGTNDFHGSGYWYFQNNDLGNAKDYFARSVIPIIQNQGGGTFGGPVYKKHTFFYGTGEVDRTRGAGGSAVASVLTTAQAAGITDPTDLALFKSNGSPSSAGGTLTSTASNASNADLWTLRIDQLLRGGKDTMSVKYGQNPFQGTSPGLTFVLTNLAGFGASNTVTSRTLTFAYSSAFGSSSTNQFRFSFGRSNPSFPANSPFPLGPTISIAGLDNFGETFIVPQGRTQNTFQYLDTYAWVRGRHTIKVGADINRYQTPNTADFFSRGQISFASVADFQNGNPSGYFQQVGNFVRHNFALDAFSFVQDDFRLTKTLTLNLGFRLESSGGVSENKNLLSNLDPNNHTPLGVVGTGPLGGLDVGGDVFHRNWNPAPRLGFAWNPGMGKLVFRGGYGITYDFIYQNPISNVQFSAPFINGVSVSAGNFTGGNTLANLVAGTATAQQQAIAALGHFNPNQVDFGTLSPVDQNLANPRTQQWDAGVEFQAPHDLVIKATYIGTHSDHLQVSVPINLVAPANRPAPATSLADQNAREAQFASVFTNEVGGTFGPQNNLLDPRFDSVTQVKSIGVSSYNALQLEGIRRFRNGFTFNANYTWSHSLDDVSDALNVLINDSANLLDAAKPLSFQRGNSQFDLRNRFVLSYEYDIPYTKNFHGWKKYVLDGWTQSAIFSAQSGPPATVYASPVVVCSVSGFTAANCPNDANGNSQLVGITDTLLNGTANANTGVTTALNGNATLLRPVPNLNNPAQQANLPVSEPLLGNDGTSGRNHLRLAGFTDLDVSFAKGFKFTEKTNFQLRWEMFNTLNHPNFAGYANSFASPFFNTYTSTANNMRQMQLSARFIF